MPVKPLRDAVSELSTQPLVHGITPICSVVKALAPPGFTACTLKPYDPGPTVPLSVRTTVAMDPTKAPVTLRT